MKKLILLLFLTGIAITTDSFCQAGTGTVKQIDAFAKAIDSKTKRAKSLKLVFADVSDFESDGPAKWQRFASEEALESHRQKNEAYTIAYVWLDGRKVVSTNFTLFSPSGDWAKYVYCYYRPDGSLARAESELRTFYGDYIGIRRQYFDKDGKILSNSVRFLDLKTRKPKKPSNEFLDGNPAWDRSDFFRSTAELPFAHLLNKK